MRSFRRLYSTAVEELAWKHSLSPSSSSLSFPVARQYSFPDVHVSSFPQSTHHIQHSGFPSLSEEVEGWKRLGRSAEESGTVMDGKLLSSETMIDRFVANTALVERESKTENEEASDTDHPHWKNVSLKERAQGKPRRSVTGFDRRQHALEALEEKVRCENNLKALKAQVASSLREIHQPQLCQRFTIDETVKGQLGEGRQGIVRRAVENASKEPVAVKTCNKFKKFFKKEDIGSVRHEVTVLRKLPAHQNMLRFVDSFESPINIHIVTELCQGGDLFSFLNASDFEPRAEEEAKRAIHEVLSVVFHCHQNGITHLDIKLENIMRRKEGKELGELVLVDFGHSRDLPTSPPSSPAGSALCKTTSLPTGSLRRPVGSPSYSAPEVVLRCKFNARSDVWSIGVVAFVLLQGYLPYPHLQLKQWRDFTLADYDSPSNDPFRYEMDWKHLSPQALDFVQGALQVNPNFRLSVQAAMNHPWLKSLNKESKMVQEKESKAETSATTPVRSLFTSLWS